MFALRTNLKEVNNVAINSCRSRLLTYLWSGFYYFLIALCKKCYARCRLLFYTVIRPATRQVESQCRIQVNTIVIICAQRYKEMVKTLQT
jgi:hypothetical protein